MKEHSGTVSNRVIQNKNKKKIKMSAYSIYLNDKLWTELPLIISVMNNSIKYSVLKVAYNSVHVVVCIQN